ncbi:MAG: DUF444 family protein [Promethearchaeota archaeon]|jgi:uncharacterized sporulation protein YeaH/YhbH (DUF444 family)
MGSTIIEQDFPHDIVHRGQKDVIRHNKRVNDAVRKQLKDIISQQDIITSEGNKKVKVRLKYLDQYRFRHNPDRSDEIGRDEFDDLENGEIISEPTEGDGKPIRAGDFAGEELYETEYTLEELTDMMIEELELPDLDETKKNEITSNVLEYTDRRKRVGIEACLDKKQTLLAHLKRRAQMRKDKQDKLTIIQDDLRFKTWEIATEKHSNAVVFLMMDRSGCHTAGHLVETPNGWKRIENIEQGERVISLDVSNRIKKPGMVSKVFKYLAPCTMRIVTEDVVLNSTPNHRYFVYTAKGIVEKAASALEEGDYLMYNMEASKSSSCLVNSQFYNIPVDVYYFIGFALGDGNIWDTRHLKGGSAYICITDKDVDNLERLSNIVENAGFKTHVKCGKRNRLHVNSAQFVDKLLYINPYLASRSPYREISDKILSSPDSAVAAFLSGLFDAEGFVSDHSVSIIMSAKSLIQQVKVLLSRFGIRARLHNKKVPERILGDNVIKAGTYYQLSVNSKDMLLFADHIGFRDLQKTQKLITLIESQRQKKNAMRSKYVPDVDIEQMSSSYAREKAGIYINGIFDCHSVSSLRTLRDHEDTSVDEQKQINGVIRKGLVLSKVKHISKQQKCEYVYDLEVLDHHNYFVDGILSHNSMWESKIYTVKALYFWIVQFLRRRYDKVEIKFIAHDYFAKELNEKEFFTIADSGGTRVSAAYKLCRDMIKHNYPSSIWNIYCFHASDGDSWRDESYCVELAGDILMLEANLFAYTEINMDNYRDGNSELFALLKRASKKKWRRLLVSSVEKTEDIMDTLRKFLKHSHETV